MPEEINRGKEHARTIRFKELTQEKLIKASKITDRSVNFLVDKASDKFADEIIKEDLEEKIKQEE